MLLGDIVIFDREPLYVCEFANGKRIRLSINFDADAVGSADRQQQPVPVPHATKGTVSVKDILVPSSSSNPNGDDKEPADAIAKVEQIPKEEEIVPDQTEKRAQFSILNEEKEEMSLPPDDRVSVGKASAQVEEKLLSPAAEPVVKDEEPARPVSRKMDITMICGSPSSEDNMSAKSEPTEKTTSTGNGIVKVVAFDSIKTEEKPNGISEATATALVAQPIEEAHSKPLVTILKAEIKENYVKNEASQESSPKKRVIIDDDHTDSSDTEASKKATVKQTASSPPPQKKRKTEAADAVKVQPAASSTDKVESSTPKLSMDSAAPAKAIKADVKTTESGDKVSKKTEEKAVAEPNGAAPAAATAAADPTENFDINCECCLKDYDMRYLDPPLVERPAGEWRCFECLVNDARGWPRRRKSTASPTSKTEATDEKPKSSSSKKRSSSSSAKRSRPSSSKSSSSKTTSNSTGASTSSSKRKKSSSGGGNSTSTSKKSSSSSSKKHKKKKSSSSHHHRSNSSSSHHRRRHHQEYSKLLMTFQARNKERLAIEEQRIGDVSRHSGEMLDNPTSWRVVSSTLDSLRVLIETLTGGSLEQERLRSRLISILKTQEKLEEERIKRQELAWQILPRRQSSRIAIGKMRSHSSGSDGSEDEFSEEEGVGGKSSRRGGVQRSSTRGTRTAETGANGGGVDSKEQLALERASRLRRRKAQEEMDGHGGNNENEDHEDDIDDDAPLISGSHPGDWINWSILKGNKRKLSTVGLAAVGRLLKEEISELFARPVDPEFDGCPDYLTIITHPMDLGTIRTRLENGSYKKWEAFKSDVERVWENCREFNGADTLISQYADTLGALFRHMCKVAEKRGARTMTDNGNSNNGDASDEDEPHHSSSSGDESKAESRTSANKEWTESSESESSGSSDDDDSDGSSDGKAKRSSRSRASGGKKPPSTMRPSPKSSSSAARSSRTQARPVTTKTKTKRRARKSDDDDDDDDESDALSSSDDSDDASSRRRRAKRTAASNNNAAPARATRTNAAASGRQASPLSAQKSTNRTASSAQQASPKANQVKKSAPPVSSPPPPPPPPSVPLDAKQQQKSPATEKSPRPAASRPSRLRVSDDSSSSDSDDDKGSSSSSSSSSSDGSADSADSADELRAPPPPQPKEPSPAPPGKKARAAIAPPLPPLGKPESAPPPPPPSPPRESPAANQPPPPPPKDNGAARPAKAKRSSSATNSKKSKVSPRVAALKLDRVGSGVGLANSSYANSPTLLNSYLSPSSSSSSYFSSSAESDSSDNNDSDSDDAGSD